ncbi:hypothetical protein HGQ17_13040 [Nesterenkonia sp. MY13]|uniref:Clp R domain-containing protein n=1 Tax=Nesterenkonia sedimenti TaxID=1463632 RepID=A0A7X8TLC6_9MICC|nr:Clp protease N-terminal domain-containing protein [Nesterenkonia sedimenti]NLS10902.1 hypothetical protein [Nesterenkonia sedimenti]
MVEEASRRGAPEADIEHLFLGMLTSDYPPGHALRRAGITLQEARQAVAAQHAHQLQLVRVETGLPAAGPITVHQTSGHGRGHRPA